MKNKFKILSNNNIKMIAIVAMFCDHFCKALLNNNYWLTYIGRLAFPLFAFLIVEGYNKTSDFKSYLKRIFIFALISEIPYNLMFGSPIYLGGMNVLFTFLISLLVIRVMDLSWKKNKILGIGVGGIAVVLGVLVSSFVFTDYYGPGVLTVVSFWLFSKIKYGWIMQLISLIYINWKIIAGECFVIMLGSYELWVPFQAIAVLSMIPILMYNGELGRGGKKFQKFAYWFYPVHMTILGLLMILFN